MSKKILARATGVALSAVVVLAAASPALAATAFESSGSFAGGPGADPGQLSNPQRAAIRTSTGQLFVADRDNDRVQVFDTATNAVTGQFGDGSVTDDPFGVAVDQATGDVYVSSSVSSTITKWSDSGLGYVRDLLFASPAQGSDPGQVGSFASPLAVDPASGDLLVADTANQRIERFDSSGTPGLDFTGEDATAPESPAFSQLKDIAVNQADGDVYVTDGGRIARYASDYDYEASLDPVAGPALVAVDPVTGDPVVSVSSDDQCATNRVIGYDGTTLESQSQVPPAANDCTAVSGLAFSSAGVLYAVNGGAFGGCCGGQMSIQVLARTATLPYSAGAEPATNVTETTARLRGSLDPGGSEVTYSFEYSTDGVGWNQVGDQGPFDDASAIPVQHNASGLSDGTAYRFRLAVRATATPGITVYSDVESFTTIDTDPPAVTLDPESGLTSSGVTLNGQVDPNNVVTGYRFEVSGDGGNNWIALPGADGDAGSDDPAGHGTAPVAVSATASGLEPHRDYLYRLIATSAVGTTQADGPAPITTAGEQAGAESLAATPVTDSSARLRGSVNPRNADTTYHFDYGTSDSYGSTTADATLPSTLQVGGPADTPFDPNTPAKTVGANVEGLSPGTVYHYRLVVDNGNGAPFEGPDQTLTTADLSPTATAGTPTALVGDSVTLHGSVDTRGLTGSAQFSVTQVDGRYSQATTPTSLGAVDGDQQLTAALAGLPPGGQFEVRVAVTTSGGQAIDGPVTFTTPALPVYEPPPAPPAASGDWFAGLPPIQPDPGQPSNVFTARSKVKGTTATITIGVPGAGVLRASGRYLAAATKRPTAKGTVTVRLTLKAAGRRALRGAKSHRLRVPLTVRFTPTGGSTRTAIRTITFKRKAGR